MVTKETALKRVNSGDDLFIRRLKIFLSVVDVMSVSTAARQLGVSQPAVSQQIRALEDMLETRLFNRIGRQLSLTETGRKTVPVARGLVGQIGSALSGLRESSRRQGLHLRLGFSAPQIALPVARTFMNRIPGASLQLTSANSSTLFERLQQFELDAIFVGLPEPHPDFECVPFLRQTLIAIVADDHPFGRRDMTSIAELSQEPLIFREVGSYTRRLFFDAARRRGFEPKIGYEIATREAMSEAVALGLGVGTVFDSEAPVHTSIRQIPIENGKIVGNEYLVCHRELSPVPPLSLLLSIVTRHSRGRQPS